MSKYFKPIVRLAKAKKGGRGRGPSGPSEVASTWDPANVGADITLSNLDKTAACGGQTGDWAISTGSKTAGKLYFELVADASNSDFCYAGVVATAKGKENTGVQGASTEMLWKRNGAWSVGGGTAPAAFVTGDILGFAFDFSTMKIRAFKNNVEQGLSPAATIVGAIKIGFTHTFGTSPNTFTIRTTTAEFSYAPPTGYIAWAAGT